MLRVLSLSTNDNLTVQNFEKTAQYFGYDYYLLGRGKKFQGWPWRTQLYIDAIKKLGVDPNDIFILCDSNDVFFVAPAEEMKDKFLAMEKRCFIGAEAACCNGKYGDRKVRHVALEGCRKRYPKARYRFPNGGFLIGFRDDLLKLLMANRKEWDDQGGYLQKFIDNSPLFDLDVDQKLIGNLPTINEGYHVPEINEFGRPEITYWKYDQKEKRFQSVLTGEYPCAFHFPGKSYSPYNIISKKLFQTEKGNPNKILLPYEIKRRNLIKASNVSSNELGIILIIVFAAVIVILVIVLCVVFIGRANKLKL